MTGSEKCSWQRQASPIAQALCTSYGSEGAGQLTWRLPSALAARAQLGSRDSLGICPVQKLASTSRSTRLGICPVPQAVPNYRWTIVRNGRRTRSCS